MLTQPFLLCLFLGMVTTFGLVKSDLTIKCWECPTPNGPDPFPTPSEIQQMERACADGDNLAAADTNVRVECTGKNPVCIKEYEERRTDLDGGRSLFVNRFCIEDIGSFFVDQTDFCNYRKDTMFTFNSVVCVCQGDFCNGSIKNCLNSITFVLALLAFAIFY